MTRQSDPRAAVLANYRAQLDAMISRDMDALDACLTEDFTLTHMTGYVQSRTEWLSEMAAGEFRYQRDGGYSRPSSSGMSIVLNSPDVVCRCQIRSATPSTPLVTWSFGIEPGMTSWATRTPSSARAS